MVGTGPSNPNKRDVDDLVNALVGTRVGIDSGELTPSSSVPGTPSMGQVVNLPVQSSLSASGSGRVSRQSDFHERTSAGATSTLIGSHNSATDHVIER